MSEYHYLGIKEILENDKYPFTEGQLRYFLMYRQDNGLYKACRKVGRRIYVREDLFDEWIDSLEETILDEDNNQERKEHDSIEGTQEEEY